MKVEIDIVEAIRLYESGHSQEEVAEILGTTQKVISNNFRRHEYRSRKRIKRNQDGENNSSWKGGRILIKSGRFFDGAYWAVRRPSHPNARQNGYVAEHILIALEAAGRERVEKNECVHHINCNKADNRPENLLICTHREHLLYHAALENLVGRLVDKGLVKFNAEKGYYFDD